MRKLFQVSAFAVFLITTFVFGSGLGRAVSEPALIPAQILDLTNWKITLPVGEPGHPTEIKQPALATFSQEPYFYVNAAKDGVVFQAHCGGTTTSGSKYPRAELREMAQNGKVNADWSPASGTHIMVVKEAFFHLPAMKPDVVGAQIHDAKNDVIEIRLKDKRLYVENNGSSAGDLDTAYKLGTPFTVRMEAAGGRIKVFYNDVLKVDFAPAGIIGGCYFKAGCYTQSNVERGDKPDEYGQVVIYGLTVTHR